MPGRRDQKGARRMKNTLGNELTVTVFGESHGPAVGCVIDGLPSGVRIDLERLRRDMDYRRAAGAISTARSEADEVKFLSGVKDGIIEGTPLTLMIENGNVRRKDYDEIRTLARPGHADYAAEMRYRGYQDASGGGHFSGRLTAPLTAAGSIVRKMLEDRGILIATHIKELHGIKDDPLIEHNIQKTMEELNAKPFAVISPRVEIMMKSMIEDAAKKKDSVGGILETAVIGMEPGIGEPIFGALESGLSAALFAIPAVKGVEFGEGFHFSDLYGSEANDRFTMFHDQVATITNHNGGINGGISNGMTIRFCTCVKPTPSIARPQFTVDFRKMENTEITIQGRHDPAIVHRARIVVDSVTALVLADALASAHGRQWLGEKSI